MPSPTARRSDLTGDIPLWPGLLVASLVGLVYLSVASGGTFQFRPSRYPHHILIADAWLHGHLYVRDEAIDTMNDRFYRGYRTALERTLASRGLQLTEEGWERARSSVPPPASLDWSVVDGKHYGYWGPMVPALLLPYVAVAGLRASDTLFSCLLGAGTVLLTFLVLREAHGAGFVPLSMPAAIALTLLFGLGTVHFYLAVAGHVWFLSQVVAVFFLTLAIYFVLRSRDGLGWSVAAGAAFGAAVLARSFILATVPFFGFAILARPQPEGAQSWRDSLHHLLAFSGPLFLAVALTLAFNYTRFGNAIETGMSLQITTGGHPRFRNGFARYGLFHLHYLPSNIYFYFFNPILKRYPPTHALTFDPEGNSMFLVTPALVYVFRAHRRRGWFTVGLWSGAGACMLLLLLCLFPGWYQFGNRFLLDLLPLAILLVAIGMEGRLTTTSALLIALSVAVNAWGDLPLLHRAVLIAPAR